MRPILLCALCLLLATGCARKEPEQWAMVSDMSSVHKSMVAEASAAGASDSVRVLLDRNRTKAPFLNQRVGHVQRCIYVNSDIRIFRLGAEQPKDLAVLARIGPAQSPYVAITTDYQTLYFSEQQLRERTHGRFIADDGTELSVDGVITREMERTDGGNGR